MNYAPLPSGRIAMNIQGVGRMVAPHWESLTRLRGRMNAARAEDIPVMQERRSVLASYQGDFIRMPNGVNSQADAGQMFKRVLDHSAVPNHYRSSIITGMTYGGKTSSFTLGSRQVRLAENIGIPRNLVLHEYKYNEFIAMNEAHHEIMHAWRFKKWELNGYGTSQEYAMKYAPGSPAEAREEIRVELASRAWTERMVKPRIEAEFKYGSQEKARRLQQAYDEFIADSDAFLARNRSRAGDE